MPISKYILGCYFLCGIGITPQRTSVQKTIATFIIVESTACYSHRFLVGSLIVKNSLDKEGG